MTDDTTDDSHEMGVEFGELDDELDSLSYPVTTEELLDDYGDHELEFQEESATLSELLEPMGDQTYESKNGVQQAVLNMVGDQAIGRKNYSDRTPPAAGEERQKEGGDGQSVENEQESF